MDTQSQTVAKLTSALCKAQKNYKPLEKSGMNPHLKKPYSTLSDIVTATRGALLEENILFNQFCTFVEGRECVVSQVTHGDEWMRSIAPVFEGNQKGAQGYGSGVTYAKRYGGGSVLGLVDGDGEDDGAAASGQANKRQSKPKADDKPSPAAFVEQLKAGINKADAVDALNKFWSNQKSGLDKLKKMDAKAHEVVTKAFTAKLAQLGDAPLEIDDETQW